MRQSPNAARSAAADYRQPAWGAHAAPAADGAEGPARPPSVADGSPHGVRRQASAALILADESALMGITCVADDRSKRVRVAPSSLILMVASTVRALRVQVTARHPRRTIRIWRVKISGAVRCLADSSVGDEQSVEFVPQSMAATRVIASFLVCVVPDEAGPTSVAPGRQEQRAVEKKEDAFSSITVPGLRWGSRRDPQPKGGRLGVQARARVGIPPARRRNRGVSPQRSGARRVGLVGARAGSSQLVGGGSAG